MRSISWLLIVTALCAVSKPASSQLPTRAATQLAAMEALSRSAPAEAASRPGCLVSRGRGGLSVVDGKVVAADILSEMTGFARQAGTSGGLGGELYVVTDARDYDVRHGERPIPGTLRHGIELARTRKVPIWITFDVAGAGSMTIDLKSQIDLVDDLTIDGSCADVTLQANQRTVMLYIRAHRNIVLYGLSLRRTDFDLHVQPPPALSDILRSDGATDRIWVAHNDFSLCGHGCFDIVVAPNEKPWPDDALARITVAFNRFRDADRVMIYGFTDCAVQQTEHCTKQKVTEYREGPTRMFLTLQGNVFTGTAQRMPRASGRAFAHVLNNVFAFQPLRNTNGRPLTSSYAAVALSGASLLVEHNWFGQLTEIPGYIPLGAWTISTEGALKLPHESEGRLRSLGNLRASNEIIGEWQPETIANPSYKDHEKMLDFGRLGFERAGACVIRRAGPSGGPSWDPTLCN